MGRQRVVSSIVLHLPVVQLTNSRAYELLRTHELTNSRTYELTNLPGLEIRVPFLDKDMLDACMNTAGERKMVHRGEETRHPAPC